MQGVNAVSTAVSPVQQRRSVSGLWRRGATPAWRRARGLGTLALFGTITLVALGPAAPAGAQPTATDLGTLGGTQSEALAVSGSLVVGEAANAQETVHAFSYRLGTKLPVRDLGTISNCPDSFSAATAVSGNVIAGNASVGSASLCNAVHAFGYDPAISPALKDLGTLSSDPNSTSHAVAVAGAVVVGNADFKDSVHGLVSHAFAYNLAAPSPVMLDLGTLGGLVSFATGVSGNNVVGASYTDPNDTILHAFAYNLKAEPPVMKDLGALTGNPTSTSQALAVSGNTVVGESDFNDPTHGLVTHAFSFNLEKNQMKDLGTLGGTTSQAVAVSGNVVAGNADTAGGDSHAFAYNLTTNQIKDLGILGGTTSEAVAVSGNVVAGYSDFTDPLNGLVTHAFAFDLGAPSPVMQDLGILPGGTYSQMMPPGQVVSGNVVVGFSDTPAGPAAVHATVWSIGSTTVTSSVNPSQVGQSVTLTATVRPTPTGGTVTFTDGGVSIPTCTGLTLTAGVATCSISFGTAGGHNIVAKYSGAGLFQGSTSPTFTQVVTNSACATLAGCNLHGLNLSNANLVNAVLAQANANKINLSNSDLSGANLTNVNLNGADLTGANLTGANLTGANINNVIWSNTTCPDGTNSDAHGGTCVGHL
jgi:probable HAF family extracellular repeat protein